MVTNGIQFQAGLTNIDAILACTYQKILARPERAVHELGTGILDLDRRAVGILGRGELIVLAGRPGVGRDFMAIQIAQHVAFDQKHPVGFLCTRIMANWLGSVVLASRGRVDWRNIRYGTVDHLENERLQVVVEEAKSAPLIVDDECGNSLHELEQRARRLKDRADIRLLVVDALEFLQATPARVRDQKARELMKTLKTIAMELDVPVVALSNLHRKLEKRKDKRPRLSDLPGGSEVEAMAETVLLVHRAHLFDPDADPDSATLILAKTDPWGTDAIPLRFSGDYLRFYDAPDAG